MTKKEITKAAEAAEGYAILKQHLPKDKRLAAKIQSVSRSGLSRQMKFYGTDFFDLTDAISMLAGYPMKNDCISVSGCGMDMIFSVLTNVNYAAMKIDGASTGVSPDKGYAGYCVDANNYRLI